MSAAPCFQNATFSSVLKLRYAHRPIRAQFRSSPRRFLSVAQLLAPADAPFRFYYFEGIENFHKYRPGGYHPISIGDTLHDRYRIVDKLGYGGSSTVWLAHDARRKRFVAVKVGTSTAREEQSDHKICQSEIDILRNLSRASGDNGMHGPPGFPFLLDEFTTTGPNGAHPCFATHVARGDLVVSKYDSLFTQKVARAICYRLASVLAWVHARGYVHGDLRLANVLACMPSTLNKLSIKEFYKEYGVPELILVAKSEDLPSGVPGFAVEPLRLWKPAKDFTLADAQVILNDYGEAFQPSQVPRPASDCRTPYPERPPESAWDPDAVISFSSDIWSLAVTFWDILGLTTLFYSAGATRDDIFAQQIEMLGHNKPPDAWLARWSRRQEFFKDDGTPVPRKDISPPLDDVFEDYVQKWRRKSRHLGCDAWDKTEAEAILSLLRQMLMFDPKQRLTAEQVLNSCWMSQWCLPEFERSVRDQPEAQVMSRAD